MEALKWQKLYEIAKRIRPPKKFLLNIQNINHNKCYELHLVIYLHPVDHHVAGIRKVDKNFADELDPKDIKFPIKIRDILRN